MWIVSILLLIFILGLIILVHELGHFFWAKMFKVHIYEFSIGMGPVLFTHKGKDNVNYNIRAVPIGGFVSMAGEVYEDGDKSLDKDKYLCNKVWWKRLIILAAGVINNFILAIVLLFVGALIWGSSGLLPKVAKVEENSAVAKAGMQDGDVITAINGKKVKTWDVAQILLVYKDKDNVYDFRVKHQDGKSEEIKVMPDIIKNEDGEETKVYGIYIDGTINKGFLASCQYAFQKFGSIMHSMALTIGGLFTGKISLKALSGPVGVYQVVDQAKGYGIDYIIYLIAFLSINVGFINILPFPAFDGGHIFFVLVEKIKGSPVDRKFENICHTVGFILLLILMVVITIQDLIRLF